MGVHDPFDIILIHEIPVPEGRVPQGCQRSIINSFDASLIETQWRRSISDTDKCDPSQAFWHICNNTGQQYRATISCQRDIQRYYLRSKAYKSCPTANAVLIPSQSSRSLKSCTMLFKANRFRSDGLSVPP